MNSGILGPLYSRPTVLSVHRNFNGTIYIMKQNYHQAKHIYTEVNHKKEEI